MPSKRIDMRSVLVRHLETYTCDLLWHEIVKTASTRWVLVASSWLHEYEMGWPVANHSKM